jgi:hypothetical protein
MTTSLNTTRIEVLTTIKKKDFMQYLSPIKIDVVSITRRSIVYSTSTVA